jgi:hypothetical protein
MDQKVTPEFYDMRDAGSMVTVVESAGSLGIDYLCIDEYQHFSWNVLFMARSGLRQKSIQQPRLYGIMSEKPVHMFEGL